MRPGGRAPDEESADPCAVSGVPARKTVMSISCVRSLFFVAAIVFPAVAWGFEPAGSRTFNPVPADYAEPPMLRAAGAPREWHAPGYYVWHGGNLRVSSYNWGYFGDGEFHPGCGKHVNYLDTYFDMSYRRQ
jgi:hypothetical protein